jgi:hypothetical protein
MKTTNLKTYKRISIIIIIIGMAISGLNFSNRASHKKRYAHENNNADASIVGAWILDTDTTYKMVFIDEHTCKIYNSNVLSETDNVILSNTSPQCGIVVPVTVNTTYMQLIDQTDATRHYCYEIIGLTNITLGFRPVDLSYPPSRFHRQ